MSRALLLLAVVALLTPTSVACGPESLPDVVTLAPDPNAMGPDDPLWSPQPRRDRPRSLCVSPDGLKAWVALAGTEDAPGDAVAVVDLPGRRLLRRVRLPGAPWACAVDPAGRHVVVTLRFSDHASVLDARTDEEVARVRVPFYTELVRFQPDGRRVWLTNRWKDSVLWWDVAPGSTFRVSRTAYDGLDAADPMGVAAGQNPSSLVFSADGQRLFVGSATGLTVAVLDTAKAEAIDVDGDPATTTPGAPKGLSHLDMRSPVGGLALWDRWLFVADTGPGTGSHPLEGRDLDDDGKPGDGTANVIFQDLQNEIAVVDTQTLQIAARYTSDTLCCQDFRDVDPDLPERGKLLPAPDTWLPDVVPFLQPKSSWIVAGALPEAMVAVDGQLWVAFAGSNEVQGFQIGGDGSLAPLQVAGGLYPTGFNPVDLAAATTRNNGNSQLGAKWGPVLITVDRLAESLTFIDPHQPPGQEHRLVVGDTSGGPFPATDAELGEAINEMTAGFTVDGDQTCVHCHRDNGAIGRPIVMPLQTDRLWGARNVMAQRGLYDTRPWFNESSMDETNFFPVLNEFARKENFCCEGLDPTVWSKYPPVEACVQDPKLAGCNHVLHCTDDPPPECAARPYAKTPFLKRAAFMRDAAQRLLGRDHTFGDALWHEAADGTRQPIPLDFDGVTRAIGLFMLRTPRLLPNPNAHLQLPSARRGEAIYRLPDTGCAGCHPLPLTTTATLPEPFSPFGMPVRFPPVLTPSLDPLGVDASMVTPGFIGSFPQTLQTAAGLHLGATPLRGLWDRPQTRFYHDGRARSLRSALATPGHAVLQPGEAGFNERFGVRDTHGGTSQLDKYQLQDLMQFLLTL